MNIKLIDTVAVQNELGEGVTWDSIRQTIWWTDISQNTLYRYQPEQQELHSWETPERLCCFAPVQGSDYLVAAFASGFAYYQPEEGILKWIKKVEQDNPGTRLNDGRTDRQGRFWAGTMVEDEETATEKGKLYCLDRNLDLTSSSINQLSITNSLCWSPDSSTLYHCDTPEQTINRYQFNASTAQVGEKRKFIQTDHDSYPDGSIVDADGFLWNAQWSGSKVVRYNPNGDLDLELAVPASQPTCVAFGGKNLDLLIVTSAHQDLSQADRQQQPEAGNLFIYQTDCTGLVESPFTPLKQCAPEVF